MTKYVDPWKIITWSPEKTQRIYREWGAYYKKTQKLNVAENYYDKSLELSPTDTRALYFRSQCKRAIAKTDQALIDAKRALEIDPLGQPYNLEVCDDLYELNQFEETDVHLQQFSKKFHGTKVKPFTHRLEVVEENLNNSLSDTLGYFAYRHRATIQKAHESLEESRYIDPRPLWKINRDNGECDLLSVLMVEAPSLTPREIARQISEFRIYNQIYIDKNWKDILFLRSLRKNEQLLLKQSNWSTKLMDLLTNSQYQVVLKFLKMLHSRDPLYNIQHVSFANKKYKRNTAEAYMFNVQYQTHRTMHVVLKNMHALRRTGQIIKLRKYVEHVMGGFVTVKTFRVMPWKFEFINEVYNLLALAMIDDLLDVQVDLNTVAADERLKTLIKVPKESVEKPVPVEFGNRATCPDLDVPDRIAAHYRALEGRLEKRLSFARYPIEKAYLWHEMARINLLQFRLDKCRILAERVIDEALSVNSYVWALLGLLMVCRAHAVVKKLGKNQKVLMHASEICKKLQEPQLNKFIQRAIKFNDAAILARRVEQRARRKRSRQLVAQARSSASFAPS